MEISTFLEQIDSIPRNRCKLCILGSFKYLRYLLNLDFDYSIDVITVLLSSTLLILLDHFHKNDDRVWFSTVPELQLEAPISSCTSCRSPLTLVDSIACRSSIFQNGVLDPVRSRHVSPGIHGQRASINHALKLTLSNSGHFIHSLVIPTRYQLPPILLSILSCC